MRSQDEKEILFSLLQHALKGRNFDEFSQDQSLIESCASWIFPFIQDQFENSTVFRVTEENIKSIVSNASNVPTSPNLFFNIVLCMKCPIFLAPVVLKRLEHVQRRSPKSPMVYKLIRLAVNFGDEQVVKKVREITKEDGNTEDVIRDEQRYKVLTQTFLLWK
eukprot:TRINITY_DN9260_c0_g1_i1.p2 TRINITY_DN9260_c0_g1~~TRINITY_DN9260_c0_g1_i1.p2  ORF type:complete len:163 (-),score=50.61 TRINITY_DN9260_c0_g1_i1:56-544(-)